MSARTVPAEGQRQDVVYFLSRDLLVAPWPVLRTLISRPLRDAWKAGFPELPPEAGWQVEEIEIGALSGRLIALHAAARHRSAAKLENLGRRHARCAFSLEDLRDRLGGAECRDDQEYVDHGLQPEPDRPPQDMGVEWATEIQTRLHAEADPGDL
jgi:hypothetical protein